MRSTASAWERCPQCGRSSARFGALRRAATRSRLGIRRLERLQRDDVAALSSRSSRKGRETSTSDEYWAAVAELCRKHGRCLSSKSADGLGRTGKLWAMSITACGRHNHGVEGTLGRLCARRSDDVLAEVSTVSIRNGARSRAFSTLGAPARDVAALATLQTIDDEDIVDRARVTGSLHEGLGPARREVDSSQVRGKGLIIGLVFGEPTSFGLKSRWKMMEGARKGSSPSLWWTLFTDTGS